jgi:hypothetical protein
MHAKRAPEMRGLAGGTPSLQLLLEADPATIESQGLIECRRVITARLREQNDLITVPLPCHSLKLAQQSGTDPLTPMQRVHDHILYHEVGVKPSVKTVANDAGRGADALAIDASGEQDVVGFTLKSCKRFLHAAGI